MQLFNREFIFKGKHAGIIKALTEKEDGIGLFERNVDVLRIAPLTGFLYQRKGIEDGSNSEQTKVFLDQLVKINDDLLTQLRAMIFLDKEHHWDYEERVQIAFQSNIETQSNFNILEYLLNYMYGGIEILGEKILYGNHTLEQKINNYYDFISDLHERYHIDNSGMLY
jgi:hypothetical protein